MRMHIIGANLVTTIPLLWLAIGFVAVLLLRIVFRK